MQTNLLNSVTPEEKYSFSTHDKRTLLFDKQRLYEIGERYLEDAKRYLYAHNQEKEGDESRAYRYHFPVPVEKSPDS